MQFITRGYLRAGESCCTTSHLGQRREALAVTPRHWPGPGGHFDEKGQSWSRRMSRTVAEALVDVLEEVGVKQVFGLIGDSLNPLGDAVRKSDIEWVGVRHEEGTALAAAGQAKLTGRLAVSAGTTG